MFSQKKYVLFSFVLVLLLIGGIAIVHFYDSNGSKLATDDDITIELSGDGFNPKDVVLRKGTRVTFTTTRDRFFWPASNLHPSHRLYAGFDPKEPIASGETWTFQFDKVGVWEYHDHLTPIFTGTITVEGDTAFTQEQNCDQGRSSSVECWEKGLFAILKNQGVTPALEELALLYNSEPKFKYSCHGITHDLGIAAYDEYVRDRDAVVSPLTSYCAGGFYHGFMEALITSTGSVEEARSFCLYLNDTLTKEYPDAALQCFHGVGHGAMDWAIGTHGVTGDVQELVDPSLEFCERAVESENERYRCASGVFNGIANLYIREEFEFKPDIDNPFLICESQADIYKESCYGNLNVSALRVAEGDFTRAAQYIESLGDEEHKISSIRYLANAVSLNDIVGTTEYEPSIITCRTIETTLHQPCIEGLAHGLLEHGKPGDEYSEAISFCSSDALSPDEEDMCYTYILSNIRGWVAIDKAKQICLSVGEVYESYCPDLSSS